MKKYLPTSPTNTCPCRKGGPVFTGHGDPQLMKPDMCSWVPSAEAGLSWGEVLFWVPISTFTSQVRLHLLHHRGRTWGLCCSCCDSCSTCKTAVIPWEVPQRRRLQKRGWGVFGFKRDRRRVKLFPLQLPHRTEIWRLKCGRPRRRRYSGIRVSILGLKFWQIKLMCTRFESFSGILFFSWNLGKTLPVVFIEDCVSHF